MTPTTPTKSPVDTIREELSEVRRLMQQARGVARNGATILTAESRLDAALSALSSLSTQPAQTTDQLLIDMLMDLSKKVANVNGIGGTRDWLVAELGVIISNAQDGVAPLPSQTDGLEEAIAQFARNFCGKWATTFCSHDSVAVVVELREALEKFMQGRSLPRQKGEPVAWMTEDSHGRTMLFHDINEARTYCDEDEEPTALYK